MARKRAIEGETKAERPKAQILQGFAFTPEGEDEALFITPATPAEIINTIPDEVLQAHAETGYARMITYED